MDCAVSSADNKTVAPVDVRIRATKKHCSAPGSDRAKTP